jgi:hypothetical protein
LTHRNLRPRYPRGFLGKAWITTSDWLGETLPTIQTEDARVVILCVAGGANFHAFGEDVEAGVDAGVAGFDSVLAAPLPLSCLAACL